MNDLISVIVPVYNVAPYLQECLDSILSQTHRNIEILVVDDGSTDEGPQICDSYAARDTRIRVFRQENQGLSAARNHGLEEARGDWIMFVDSDDYVKEDFCSHALSLVRDHQCEIGVFTFACFDSVQNYKPVLMPETILGKLDRGEAMRALAYEEIRDYAWNKIYCRSLFDGIRYPVGEIFEDIATTYLLFDRADHVYVDNRLLYWYRRREDSIMGTYYGDIMAKKLYQRRKEYAFLQEHWPQLAPGIERAIFNDELDLVIGNQYRKGKEAEYQEAKKMLLSHKGVFRKYGIKKVIFLTALRLSDRLFWIATTKRRNRNGGAYEPKE